MLHTKHNYVIMLAENTCPVVNYEIYLIKSTFSQILNMIQIDNKTLIGLKILQLG